MGLKKSITLTITALFFAIFMPTASALINIVAAENTYGEVAKELGGPYVKVTSILDNPSQDPHLFSLTPSVAKAISQADIVVYNGADYDPWIQSMLTSEDQKNRQVINVASLMNIKPGENPHIWYLPATMPVFAKSLVARMAQRDPDHRQYYETQLKQFNKDYQIIFTTAAKLKQRFQDTPVIATEPVFGYMAQSIGLKMHGYAFQINMMNDEPPTISQIKDFQNDLDQHTVHVLIYNNQVVNPLTEHIRMLAEKDKIPLLGVSEMIPPGMTFIQWMMQELTGLENALNNGHRT